MNNAFNISRLFCDCSSLEKLPDISKWNTSNVLILMLLFFNCSSLKSLPDISKWNIFNPNLNISSLNSFINFEDIDENRFKSAYKLSEKKLLYEDIYLGKVSFEMPKMESFTKEEFKKYILPHAFNLKGLFEGCSSLKYLPDISKWNIKNSKDISSMFLGCHL